MKMSKIMKHFSFIASVLTTVAMLHMLSKNALVNIGKNIGTLDLGPRLPSGKLQPQHYSLIPKSLCAKDTHILVAVISHIKNQTRRNEIRNCWRGIQTYNASCWSMCHDNKTCDLSKLRLVFVTGRTNNNTIQKNLENEHSQFDDIIQGPFNDTYRNLVHKSMLMLDYAVNYCRSAKFIQKIDDNVYLNMSAVSHILMKHPEIPEGYIIGYKTSKSKVARKGKWEVPETEYKANYYPDYVNGPSYIISKNASNTLLNVALIEPLVHVEDAFITGICRNKTNVHIIHSLRFCLTKRTNKCVTAHKW